jgi:hypothetical protein
MSGIFLACLLTNQGITFKFRIFQNYKKYMQ